MYIYVYICIYIHIYYSHHIRVTIVGVLALLSLPELDRPVRRRSQHARSLVAHRKNRPESSLVSLRLYDDC